MAEQQLPTEWRHAPLADVTTKIGSGATPRGGSSVYVDTGTVFIRSQNVRDNAFALDGLAYITDAAAGQLRGVTVQKGDVLLNITGDSILRCCLVPTDALPARVSQHVAIIRSDGSVLPRIIQSYLVSPSTKDHLLSLASGGATRKAITKAQIEQIEIPIPPADEQRAIAEVLGALDDKIAANTRLAATLEDLALAEAATVTSRIPLGAVVMQHKAPIDPVRIDVDRVAHFSLPAFDSGRIAEFVSPSEIKSQKFVVGQPSVLVSKLNPRFPRVWDVPELPGVPALASTEFLVLEPSRFTSTLLWALMAQPEFGAALESKVAGTSGSHQRVRPDDLLSTPIGNPRDVDAQVAALVTALGLRSHRARSESVALAATRDALLPALVSGKLRVRDAERAVEQAV